MNTEPIEVILTRDVYKTDRKMVEFANKTAILLDEIVNFSTVIFHNSIISKPETNALQDTAIFLFLLNAIELADSISVCIRNGLAAPGLILLRSLFEAFLNIKYLTLEQDLYLQRSISFLIFNETYNINIDKQFIQGTDQNRAFNNALLENEIKIPFNEEMNKVRATHNIEIREKRLEEIGKNWPEIYTEYESKREKVSHWFSLFNGPKTIEELAKRVNRPLDYRSVYKISSEISHCDNIISRYGKRMSKSNKENHILRDASEIKILSTNTLQYLLSILSIFINTKYPEAKPKYSKWYKEEISTLYLELINSKDL